MDFNLETLANIGKKILTVAPVLAGAVLSPNPLTVVAALGAIKKAIGISPDAAEGEVETALSNATPEQLLALTAENHRFQEEMGRQRLEEFKAALNDVQSARGMKVEETRITGTRDLSGEVFDWIITLGFFV